MVLVVSNTQGAKWRLRFSLKGRFYTYKVVLFETSFDHFEVDKKGILVEISKFNG
jgi:hypothetical protein